MTAKEPIWGYIPAVQLSAIDKAGRQVYEDGFRHLGGVAPTAAEAEAAITAALQAKPAGTTVEVRPVVVHFNAHLRDAGWPQYGDF